MNKIIEKKLRKLIREEIEKELNIQSEDILPLTINNLFYDLKNSDDMTMAGCIDSYLIDNKWGGDSDKYNDEDGYSLRDKIIDDITSGLQDKLNDLLTSYDSINEGDYEISNKLSSSEIEKKKKEIKRKDPKATIAVKDPMLNEEDEEDLDDDAVDKQAQKGAKTINRKASKLDRVTRDLVQLQNIMKEMAKKYQTAEGEEKEKIVADLKQKTKAKKELEALKAQLESGVVGKGGEVGLEIDDTNEA